MKRKRTSSSPSLNGIRQQPTSYSGRTGRRNSCDTTRDVLASERGAVKSWQSREPLLRHQLVTTAGSNSLGEPTTLAISNKNVGWQVIPRKNSELQSALRRNPSCVAVPALPGKDRLVHWPRCLRGSESKGLRADMQRRAKNYKLDWLIIDGQGNVIEGVGPDNYSQGLPCFDASSESQTAVVRGAALEQMLGMPILSKINSLQKRIKPLTIPGLSGFIQADTPFEAQQTSTVHMSDHVRDVEGLGSVARMHVQRSSDSDNAECNTLASQQIIGHRTSDIRTSSVGSANQRHCLRPCEKVNVSNSISVDLSIASEPSEPSAQVPERCGTLSSPFIRPQLLNNQNIGTVRNVIVISDSSSGGVSESDGDITGSSSSSSDERKNAAGESRGVAVPALRQPSRSAQELGSHGTVHGENDEGTIADQAHETLVHDSFEARITGSNELASLRHLLRDQHFEILQLKTIIRHFGLSTVQIELAKRRMRYKETVKDVVESLLQNRNVE